MTLIWIFVYVCIHDRCVIVSVHICLSDIFILRVFFFHLRNVRVYFFITVTPAKPNIVSSSQSANVSLGDAMALTCNATSADKHQWYYDNIKLNEESSTLEFSCVIWKNVGSYSCVGIVKDVSSVHSDSYLLTVEGPS